MDGRRLWDLQLNFAGVHQVLLELAELKPQEQPRAGCGPTGRAHARAVPSFFLRCRFALALVKGSAGSSEVEPWGQQRRLRTANRRNTF